MKNGKTFHVGVIGPGMISGAYLDTLTSRFEILKVDAVAGRNLERAQKVAEQYGIRACSIDQLLADPSIDIILNLTPPTVHEEMIGRILQSGKHAYTEKCFAMDSASAIRMCRLAEEKGLYLGTAPDTFFPAGHRPPAGSSTVADWAPSPPLRWWATGTMRVCSPPWTI